MLHELLLALVGHTGDFVIEDHRRSAEAPFSDEPTFKLAPDLSFIEPAERGAVESLISLGFYYRELDRFATESRNWSFVQSSGDGPLPEAFALPPRRRTGKASVYRRAIANGIVEILSVYRAAVLQVEQNLLADPMPILATVTKGLNKFGILLPPLYELVVEIEREDIRGGQLLNLLHKRCRCGIPELQACIQRLLWHGHQVMYNQLASWMIYGILQDQHGEFFIRRHDARDVERESSHPDSIEQLMQKSSDDASLTDWHLGFHIFLEMLPEYIHMRVAESVLFAGKAVRVLRHPSSTFKLQESFVNRPILRGSHKDPGSLGYFSSEKLLHKGMDLIAEELLPRSEADKIEGMLQELKKSPEFHKRLFESSISSIRTIAANHLWQLVVIRADLNGHLKALKDYFLLAKGDFFQNHQIIAVKAQWICGISLNANNTVRGVGKPDESSNRSSV